MTKQIALAVLLLTSLFVASCKKETCARCERREYCVECDQGVTFTACGSESDSEDYVRYCTTDGGTVTSNTNILLDSRELCNEDELVVNEFMDEKVADGYTCEYVD